jgi:hypothetical protein
MDTLPSELLNEILQHTPTRPIILHSRLTCRQWLIIANRVVFERHWAGARLYGEAIRVHMDPKSRACIRFMHKHAISNHCEHEILPVTGSTYRLSKQQC